MSKHHISPFNSSGYPDPTAHDALEPIAAEEAKVAAEMSCVVGIIKWIIDKAGFELLNRIELKHKKSGKVFR